MSTITLIQNSDEFFQIAVSHESGLLAMAVGSEVRICDTGTIEVRDSFEIPRDSWGVRLAWSPDDRSLLIVFGLMGKMHIQVYDVVRQQTLAVTVLAFARYPVLAWDPDVDESGNRY